MTNNFPSHSRFEAARTATENMTRVNSRPSNNHDSAAELLRPEAPMDEVQALFEAIAGIRGIQRIEVRPASGGRLDDANWTGHLRVYVRGTRRALDGAKNLIMLSGLREVDHNADHDHARCIAHARSLGVPESWAHRVETYLSM